MLKKYLPLLLFLLTLPTRSEIYEYKDDNGYKIYSNHTPLIMTTKEITTISKLPLINSFERAKSEQITKETNFENKQITKLSEKHLQPLNENDSMEASKP